MGLRPHRQLPHHTTSTTVDQPFGYTGAYLDTTGLYKMGARSYDHTTNRFTQPDPSGKETNPYLYATGDPINRVDPTGLYDIVADLTAAGAAAAGIVTGTLAGAPFWVDSSVDAPVGPWQPLSVVVH